jgi:hypothetical protein
MMLPPIFLGLLLWLIRRPWPKWMQARAGIPPVQGFHRSGFACRDADARTDPLVIDCVMGWTTSSEGESW